MKDRVDRLTDVVVYLVIIGIVLCFAGLCAHSLLLLTIGMVVGGILPVVLAAIIGDL